MCRNNKLFRFHKVCDITIRVDTSSVESHTLLPFSLYVSILLEANQAKQIIPFDDGLFVK